MVEIYVDADACPAKAETVQVAARHSLKTYLVSDGGIRPRQNTLVELVIVDQGPDAADDWIADHIQKADICVTNHHLYAVDVALGGMLLDRPDRPHEVVVFDEAHQLEEVFSATFGFQLTPGRFRWLSRVARAVISETALLDGLDDLHMRLGAWLDAHADRRIVPGVDSDLDQILDLAESRLERLLTAARSTVNDDQAGKRRRYCSTTHGVGRSMRICGPSRSARLPQSRSRTTGPSARMKARVSSRVLPRIMGIASDCGAASGQNGWR